ncbi:OLC1v1024419C1 [Oldenlandia corymbosa var. corymbosa]|uniref:Glycosyltransferase n=1 Tax=Oldenlandia corymbosa var. corymbosa TaxID=529605 RepID=A0AAV1C540_OLDCO|nr:OLC1v1024419C1 [Oldenlandia corymbosa var. corymbosa]
MAANNTHFVIFPFMAKGHTIPLLYFANLLSQRHLHVTVVTTQANSASIKSILNDPSISVAEIDFPTNIDGVPPGVESTDQLPSMSLYFNFISATKLLRPQFEKMLQDIKPPVSCIVSDAFLGWTQDVAAELGIPRIGFYGMSCYAMTMYTILGLKKPHALTTSADEPFSVPDFPKLTFTRSDFDPPFDEIDPKGPWVDFIIEQNIALAQSYGMIVNGFYDLEAEYTDYWNRCFAPKAWCVGPLCLGKPKQLCDDDHQEGLRSDHKKLQPNWRLWLDRKLETGVPVLYVAFGTQADLSTEQLIEMAEGLEKSNVSFLWVLRPNTIKLLGGHFEEMEVNGKGMIVGEWVDQMEILAHQSIKGFLSHCGWNSVTESVCAKVPILAMPFLAEQHLNARFVVEEIGVGIRVWPCNGSVRGFVKSDEVEKRVRELMEGAKGEEVRKKMEKFGEAACAAMREGGSSWSKLDQIIHDVSNYQPS